MQRGRRILLVGALLSASGCVRTSTGSQKAESERILRAVEHLVAAAHDEKGPPLAQLEATPCTDNDACQLKATCVDAFRPLVESMTLQREIRAEITAAQGAPLAPERARELESKATRATGAKQQAEERLGSCLQATGRARQRFR